MCYKIIARNIFKQNNLSKNIVQFTNKIIIHAFSMIRRRVV